MPYVRPTNSQPLTPDDKSLLIDNYLTFYEALTKSATDTDYSALNAKLPKAASKALLDEVGSLLNRAAISASKNGDIREFLDNNPLPDSMKDHLPDEFRAFCLLLNSLKQWVSAESAATDRYLLGGTARTRLRQAATHCMVTAEPLEKIELHHPVRDGRPPIPLSPAGHRIVEESILIDGGDTISNALRLLKKERSWSWKMLRDGSSHHLGEEVLTRTKASINTARTFANKAKERTGLSYKELIEWLDENELGL